MSSTTGSFSDLIALHSLLGKGFTLPAALPQPKGCVVTSGISTKTFEVMDGAQRKFADVVREQRRKERQEQEDEAAAVPFQRGQGRNRKFDTGPSVYPTFPDIDIDRSKAVDILKNSKHKSVGIVDRGAMIDLLLSSRPRKAEFVKLVDLASGGISAIYVRSQSTGGASITVLNQSDPPQLNLVFGVRRCQRVRDVKRVLSVDQFPHIAGNVVFVPSEGQPGFTISEEEAFRLLTEVYSSPEKARISIEMKSPAEWITLAYSTVEQLLPGRSGTADKYLNDDRVNIPNLAAFAIRAAVTRAIIDCMKNGVRPKEVVLDDADFAWCRQCLVDLLTAHSGVEVLEVRAKNAEKARKHLQSDERVIAAEGILNAALMLRQESGFSMSWYEACRTPGLTDGLLRKILDKHPDLYARIAVEGGRGAGKISHKIMFRQKVDVEEARAIVETSETEATVEQTIQALYEMQLQASALDYGAAHVVPIDQLTEDMQRMVGPVLANHGDEVELLEWQDEPDPDDDTGGHIQPGTPVLWLRCNALGQPARQWSLFARHGLDKWSETPSGAIDLGDPDPSPTNEHLSTVPT